MAPLRIYNRPNILSQRRLETGVNSKPKSHVTIRHNILEEIGNRVTARAAQVAKKAQNTKGPVQPRETTNVNKQLKPTASMEMLAPKGPSAIPEDASMKEENTCQAFSDALLYKIEDIDNEDWNNPQLCSDYVKDIYQYLRQLEILQFINPHCTILVDWLVQIHSKFRLLQETLYVCVPVSQRKLQLVWISALLLASKYEEMFSPNIEGFVYITDNAYTKLKFELGGPLPLHFLRQASKAGKADVEQHTLAKYLMELTLIDYDMMHYHPSKAATAASCLSQKNEVLEVMQHVAKNVLKVNENLTKFIAIKNKYASSKFLKISMIPQLNSKAIKDLAFPLMGGS
uniref:Cyclin N-terminal domain-containing protein n=1 Tax=Nomascus leucogenys TaxID=61853 RepID=A0A2I3HJW0_NOMLE